MNSAIFSVLGKRVGHMTHALPSACEKKQLGPNSKGTWHGWEYQISIIPEGHSSKLLSVLSLRPLFWERHPWRT